MSTTAITTTRSGSKALAATAFLMVALLGVTPAGAAPLAGPTVTKVAEVTPVQVQQGIATDTADDQTNCSRARRRLWVDGEGWIVRRVTTCR